MTMTRIGAGPVGRLALGLALVTVGAVGLGGCASSGERRDDSGKAGQRPADQGAAASEPAAPAQGAGEDSKGEDASSLEQGESGIVKHRVYTTRIGSEREWEAYSTDVAGERFGKALIALATDEVYYFDVNVYQMHTEFVFAELYKEPESPARLADFLGNYDEDKPEFILLYLIHHQANDIWSFAFWEGDRMQAGHVQHAYKRLKETFFEGSKLRFRPDSWEHQQVAAQLEGIPTVTNEQIYSSAPYQLFNAGERVGRLRIIDNVPDDQLANLIYKPEQILVLNEAIPTLTVVSGILTEEFSTPLSHLGLRARAWGIPHVGLKGVTERYRHLDGQMVYFKAEADGHELRPATRQEIAAWERKKSERRAVQVPKANLKAYELKSLEDLTAADAPAYGSKASNLGAIVSAKLPGFQVPPGFGLPIKFYDQHMSAHKLDKRVAKLLKDKAFLSDGTVRQRELDALRKAIVAARLDDKLLDAIVARAQELGIWAPESKGIFVRSSTNAEDLPGFNGAGLYDTIPNVRGREAIGEAVKEVWASVWNLRAYEEREYFGIDHAAVYGAVLLEEGVNATAAGVLITANIFDPLAKSTYTINAKSGLGMRVVEGRKVPEQILFDHASRQIRILSRSDESTMLVFDGKGGVKEVPVSNPGQPVLTDERAARLVDVAHSLTTVFPPEDPLDIEWLFEGETIHIVQSRPYVRPE